MLFLFEYHLSRCLLSESFFYYLCWSYQMEKVFNANWVSIFSFKKHAFTDRVFTWMLLYRKQFTKMEEFLQRLKCSVATYSIDITAGDFNYDLLKVPENNFLDIFTDHVQMVNKPTHTSGSLIDHFYIRIFL